MAAQSFGTYIIYTYVTPRYKECREPRLSVLNNTVWGVSTLSYKRQRGVNKKNVEYLLIFKSLQIPSKILLKNPHLKNPK
jgi:hypothetical protein